MEWMAKNKVTKAVSGPHSDEYKNAMETNASTWRRHIWTPVTAPIQAVMPASLAEAVKPAKIKAGTTSGEGE